jgi:hypothetical protein
MGMAAGALSLASTGLSAMSSISQGKTNAANARRQGNEKWFEAYYQAGQLEISAQMGELKATQTADFMTRQMNGVEANIDAVSALSGATDNSPSTWAVRNRYQNQAEEARGQMQWNAKMDALSKRNAAALYRMSGEMAVRDAESNARDYETNGMLGAIGGVLKGFSGMNFGS